MRFLSLLVLISFLATACSSTKKSAEKEMERREAAAKKEQVEVKSAAETSKEVTETKTTTKKVETVKAEPIVVEEAIADVEADELYQYPVVQSSTQSHQVHAVTQPVIIQQAPAQVQYSSDGDIIAYKTVTTTTIEEFDVEDQESSSETTTITSSNNSDSEILEYVDNTYGDLERYTVEDFSRESSDLYSSNTANDLVVISRPATSARVVSYSGDFTSGLYEVSKTCNLRSAPSKSSSALGYVSSGKVIWADNATTSFAKVYRKSGTAYLHKGCL